MATGTADPDWPRACRRGAVIGLVLASHAALLVAIMVPPLPRRPAVRASRDAANVLRVELLPAARPSAAPPPWPHALPTVRAAHHTTGGSPLRMQRKPALQATLAPATATTSANPMPVFVAGGGFAARLRAAQAGPTTPALPGGHHYLAADLQFQSIEQRSLAGKVHKFAGMLFGWYDPACKNIEYELAKSRAQMLADGYTMRELQQRLRDHHCR
ncbi:MAG TPA: hypothetical protein VFL63_08455 [Rhodanobacteraceae bacterium]|nr:hypothetical protein [Rhodanobacteraceae bacterium]